MYATVRTGVPVHVTPSVPASLASPKSRVLSLLDALPEVPVAEHAEVLKLVRSRKLHGQGLGWIDMHLMASALLAACPLWTLDRRLNAAARRLCPPPR